MKTAPGVAAARPAGGHGENSAGYRRVSRRRGRLVVTVTTAPGAGRGVLRRRGRRALAVGAALTGLLLLTAGCDGPERGPAGQDTVAGLLADCAGLTSPPTPTGSAASEPSAPVESTPVGTTAATPAGPTAPPSPPERSFPDVGLPCLSGGAKVSLGALRGPAVVNLWGSWCPPCRKELPAFQRLAERGAGRLHVVGVDTKDRRDDGRSLAAELGLTFPSLFDESGTAQGALGQVALPVTLMVDGQGRIRHLDNSGALDDAALAALVERHLSVMVPPR